MGSYATPTHNKSRHWANTSITTATPVVNPEPHTIGQSTLRIVAGNLVDCAVEGLVCYASSSLALHSVVASQLVEVGGTGIRTECAKHLPVQVGDAVVVSAGKLPARYLLVAVTNHIKGTPSLASIRSSIEAVLHHADHLGLQSLAIPTIRVSKQIAPDDVLLATLGAIVDHLSGKTFIKHITLVMDDLNDFPLLAQNLPASLHRLSSVGHLRAAVRPLTAAEQMIAQASETQGASQAKLLHDQLHRLVAQQLELQQAILNLLCDQQAQLGIRWQASHQSEIELTQHEISRLCDTLGVLGGEPGIAHQIGR